jgi:hypothetical protein
LDLSVFLDELTWYATSACNDVIDFITTDSVPPAYTGPGEGLWKSKVYDQVPKEIGMINEPAAPIPH